MAIQTYNAYNLFVDHPDKKTIDELIREINEGQNVNENSEQLHKLFCARVNNFFRKRNLSEEDCDELEQETFLRVFNGLKKQQVQVFEAYLLRIEINLVNDFLRRKYKTPPHESLDQPSGDESEDFPPRSESLLDSSANQQEKVLDEEKLKIVLEAMQELTPQQRKCVERRLPPQEMSHKEIATDLGISPTTVRQHLFIAKKTLKEKLRPYFGELDLWKDEQSE